MKEVGFVHKIKGGTATVRFERKTACENCNMCLKPKEEMYVELKLKNILNAKVGDKVEVTMGERAVLTASFIVYIVPLILMAITIACTYTLEPWISVVSSIASLMVGFIGVSLVDKLIIRKKSDYLPVMSAIIEENINEKE